MIDNTHRTVMTFAVAVLALFAVSCAFVAFSDDGSEVDAATSYRLHFDMNGGSGGPSDLTATSDDSYYTFVIPESPEPVAPSGMVFIGWSEDPSQPWDDYWPGDEIDVDEDEPTFTLYAAYAYVYTISYDTQGGSSVSDTSDWEYADEDEASLYVTDEVPTRADCTFAGWAETPGGDVYYTAGSRMDMTVNNRDVTLYAVWIEGVTFGGDVVIGSTTDTLTFTKDLVYGGKTVMEVTFQLSTENNGQTWLMRFFATKENNFNYDVFILQDSPEGGMYSKYGSPSFNENWEIGEYKELAHPSMNHTAHPMDTKYEPYVFAVGLYSNELNNEKARVEVSIDFEQVFYYSYTTTVVFNDNGGSGGPGTMSEVRTEQTSFDGNETITPASQPVRDGFSFAGWSTTANGDVVYQPGQDIEVPYGSNLTLYAIWSEPNATVTFMSNGSVYQTVSVPIGQTVTMPEDPELYGYTFKGWFTDNTFLTEFDSTTLISGNLTLYAKWEGNLQFTTDPIADGVVTAVAGSPGTVYFSATASKDYTSVLWDFGDGTEPSDNTYVTHYYSQPGTYTATLTVYNNYGSDTTEFIIEVPDSTTGGGDSDLLLWIAVGLVCIIAGGLVIRRFL